MSSLDQSLNQAGTSWPKPDVVQAAVVAALRATPAEQAAGFDAEHARVARAWRIPDPGRLLLTPGATSALAVAVTDHAWTAGDRVLVSGLEHHALHRPVTLLRERGVHMGVISRGADEPLDLDHLRTELSRGGVKLVAMTAACNVTGELLPLHEIVTLAHEFGALCLIDGAQIAGWLPLDLPALGVDLFAFAGHKALHAPWGIGGLYVAPGLPMSSPAATCALPTGAAAAAPPACATMPGYCDVGSVDRLALAGLVAALDWLDTPEQAERLSRARTLTERMTSALERHAGVTLHGVRDPERRLPTVAFTVAGRTVASIAADFARAGLTVGAGQQCAPLAHETLGTAPDGVVRLSVGPANSENDIDRALDVLSRM